MGEKIVVSGIEIELIRKPIKNMYLRLTKEGKAVVSAPLFLSESEILRFVYAKEEWLKKAIRRKEDRQENLYSFVDGEVHTLLGKKYVLRVDTSREKGYYFRYNDIVICVGNDSGLEKRRKALAAVYREAMEEMMPEIIDTCQKKTGLYASEWRIRDMKTRWGSCNTREKRIWLSLWLMELPVECIESVVFHELTHLKIKGHGRAFYELLKKYCPRYDEISKGMRKIKIP